MSQKLTVRTRVLMLALVVAIGCLAQSAFAVQCSVPDEPEINGGDHMQHTLHQLFSCNIVLLPAASTAVSQLVIRPAGFGTGANGYFYHYGVSLLDTANSDIVRSYMFPTMFHEREIYAPSLTEKHIWKRVGRVALHGLFQSDSGQINMSGLPASFALAGLSDAYYPSVQQRWPATLRRAGAFSAGFFVKDLMSEFRPEMCRAFGKLHVHC